MQVEVVTELFGEARAEQIPGLRRAVARAAVQEGAEREVIADVALCTAEALANVVRHAYGGRPGPIEVTVVQALGQELEVIVRDMGKGLPCPPPSPGARSESGFGLRLIERLSERSSVTNAPGGGTEVRMSFPLANVPVSGAA